MKVSPELDPNVKIPAAVKAAGKRADDKHKETYSKPAPAAEESTDDPKEEPKVEAEASPEPTKPAELTPAPTAEAPPKVTSEVTTPAMAEEDTWKHRYDSMKGRFDRSQTQIREMSEQISQLQRLLASRPTDPVQDAPASPESFITAEEENDYGKEFLGVVGKKAQEVVSREVSALRQQVTQLTKQLENVGGYVANDAQTRFYNHLDTQMPKWRDLNNDTNFISWLKLPDTYSGAIRHDLLKAAYERNDAPRVLAFFNGFLAEEAVVDPAKPSPGLELSPGAEPSAQNKVPLADLAAPGRAKSTAATSNSAPAEKPIITRVQISQFYNDVSAGKYRGKEAEKDRLEKMIFDAEKDGRIR